MKQLSGNILDANPKEIVAIGERQNLAMPLELEEGAPPALFRMVLAVLSGFVVLILVWANIAQVREISNAKGQISPSEPIRQIAHLEGGIVEGIDIEIGQPINAGDAIVRLRAQSGDASFEQYSARRADLRIRAERLSAQASGREPDFSKFATKWRSLVADQKAIFRAAQTGHVQTMRALEAQEASALAELNGARAGLEEKREQLSLAAEQLSIQQTLIEGGFTSRQALIEAKSAHAAARENLVVAQTRLQQSERAHQGAKAEIERTQAQFREEASEKHAEAAAAILELERPFAVSEDRNDRLVIRSPITGVVNDILVSGAGDVVRPGQPIAEIVPVSAKMVAEIRVRPRDIGHVAIGQPAEITVSTFDPKKYGALEGVISQISADSFVDERTGELFFRARIEFDERDEELSRLIAALSPGMEVDVRIVTQARTLMTYILKPVVRSMDAAFTER